MTATNTAPNTAPNTSKRHKGTGHYITQKLTALLLILLSFWLVPNLMGLAQLGFTQDALQIWLQPTANIVLLSLFFLFACIHFYGHLEEVVLDYISAPTTRCAALLALKLIAISIFISAAYGIFFMSFIGSIQP